VATVNLQLDLPALESLIGRVVEETINRLEAGHAKIPAQASGSETAAAGGVLLLRSQEAAKTLGISERKLWELTRKGKIPHVRIGRAVRYDTRDLRAWVETMKG
jgi:excisionase family DNA binding protein